MSKFKKPSGLTHPNAAGIDIGASSHFVAVPPDRDEQPVREFPSFTEGLHALADWPTACGADTVAVESTGVYWVPLFELLEARGFTVYLVNARHVKNVPGRKSDVLDCQWLQQLMGFGLLSGAFRPHGDFCALRTVARLRETLLRGQARHIQHIQKALLLMNLLLMEVISDVTGETGQKIIRAILAGERDGQVLAKRRNNHIQASEEDIAKALQGSWREEHLSALKQAVALYAAYAAQLLECGQQLEKMLKGLARHDLKADKPKRRGGKSKNAPSFDARTLLLQLCGVDLARIDGIDVTTAFKVLTEIGADLSRFKNAKHFASWLGPCPGTKISGGKVISAATKPTTNRAAQALKMAAMNLRNSQSALGAYYRGLCARMDKGKAVTACAHKLARLIYAMPTKGEEYVDQGQEHYEEKYRQRIIKNLTKRAGQLGLQLTPVSESV
ncbi:IS110 family transposase [Methyloglobulus sp.]|uniref:IS110 family transposase n=1 Tax=Methyloglobulus sp. TaxID=2518622 RepID=UPI003988D1F4